MNNLSQRRKDAKREKSVFIGVYPWPFLLCALRDLRGSGSRSFCCPLLWLRLRCSGSPYYYPSESPRAAMISRTKQITQSHEDTKTERPERAYPRRSLTTIRHLLILSAGNWCCHAHELCRISAMRVFPPRARFFVSLWLCVRCVWLRLCRSRSDLFGCGYAPHGQPWTSALSVDRIGESK